MNNYPKKDKNAALRKQIIEYAWEQFYDIGLKKVKVDELAAHFSISKRTLYEMFEDKQQLIITCFKQQFDKRKKDIENIKKQPGSILEKYVLFICQRIRELSGLNPIFYQDATKYPLLMKFLEESAKERNKTAMDFIKQCIRENLLIKDFNYHIILDIYNLQLANIVRYGLYRRYRIEDILNTMSIILFRGCCTQKGLEVLEDVRRKLNDDL